MRRNTTIMSAGLILLTLGLATMMRRPEVSPGRLLTDSDLAKIRGLSAQTRGNTTYPVGCEAFNVGAGQVTPQQCLTTNNPQNLDCEVCSDRIATYQSTGPSDSGPGETDDGNYQCRGQQSTAPCTANGNGGQCGTYAPLAGVFCTNLITDWDPQQ